MGPNIYIPVEGVLPPLTMGIGHFHARPKDVTFMSPVLDPFYADAPSHPSHLVVKSVHTTLLLSTVNYP